MKNETFYVKSLYSNNAPDKEVVIRLAIVDDDPAILETEETLARSFFEDSKYKCQIKSYLHPKQLLQELKERTQSFDLFLIDIEMEELSGQELMHQIRDMYPESIMIIVSNYTKYAIDGYRYGVLRYIYKPELQLKLGEALEKACQFIYQEQCKQIVFITSGEKVILQVREVMLVHYERKYSFFYTTKTFCKMRCTLSEALSLLESEPFVQTDRAYAVNVRYISSMDEDIIYLMNGREVPVSRRRRRDVVDKIAFLNAVKL